MLVHPYKVPSTSIANPLPNKFHNNKSFNASIPSVVSRDKERYEEITSTGFHIKGWLGSGGSIAISNWMKIISVSNFVT